MYFITLECAGLPHQLGFQAAADITAEFAHRPWNGTVRCIWDGQLRLYAEDYWGDDAGGLLDEFSDAISACVSSPFDGTITVVSIELLREFE